MRRGRIAGAGGRTWWSGPTRWGTLAVSLLAFHATASSALATLIYYSDYGAGAVYRTDGHTTKTLVTGLNQPMKIVLVSDGSFYVAIQSGQTLRHFSSTGVPIGASFATGLYHTGLALGPDGKLYVSATDNTFSVGYIQRYNLGTNTPAPSVYTDHSPAQYTQFSSSSYFEGLTFGPDGHLYASANGAAAIFEYQGSSEASPGTFIKSIASGFSYLWADVWTRWPAVRGRLQQQYHLSLQRNRVRTLRYNPSRPASRPRLRTGR
jgi:hypothetical protein